MKITTQASQISKTKTPRGMATHLPAGALLRRYVQDTILSTFFKWGYREIIPPVFEYLDVLSSGLSSGLLEKSYKFVDRDSGKLMLLRPDITPQVAKMVAGILADEPKPLRLCYYGNVFRHEESHAGREQEMFQVGCELAGVASPDADAEIIAVASEAIKKFGIEDFKVVTGHAGYLCGMISYIKSLLDNPLSPDDEHALKEAIGKRDEDLMESMLDGAGVERAAKKNMLQALTLFGGEEIFGKAAKIVNNIGKDSRGQGFKGSSDINSLDPSTPRPLDPYFYNKESLDAIGNLRQIYDILCLYGLRDHILIDLCELRGGDYYTGMFFEMFHPGIAYPLGRGGRYDNLIGRFGYDCPSTGFAIDVESIIAMKERYGAFFIDDSIRYLVTGQDINMQDAIGLVRQLRDGGHRVVMDTGLASVAVAVKYAKKNNIEKVITIEGVGKRNKQFSVIDVKTGKKTWAHFPLT
ncbi:MAG: ATP phosphoribosyltransferase regulatory subunit [Nitrospirae bacterium]|nr:ATP phosphoribosyltransferase regulatory subunit [Nitrospirota bacterium]